MVLSDDMIIGSGDPLTHAELMDLQSYGTLL